MELTNTICNGFIKLTLLTSVSCTLLPWLKIEKTSRPCLFFLDFLFTVDLWTCLIKSDLLQMAQPQAMLQNCDREIGIHPLYSLVCMWDIQQLMLTGDDYSVWTLSPPMNPSYQLTVKWGGMEEEQLNDTICSPEWPKKYTVIYSKLTYLQYCRIIIEWLRMEGTLNYLWFHTSSCELLNQTLNQVVQPGLEHHV